VRLAAVLARDLACRGVLQARSAEAQRRLLAAFAQVLAEEEHEWDDDDAGGLNLRKLWGAYGLACLPGVALGDLKCACEWVEAVPEPLWDDVPACVPRQVGG
jgi:hypothetical protein